MRIDEEMYKIASANYGVDLKEPIFVAFDKLISESKFGLLRNFIDNDYAEIEENLSKYLNTKTTSKTLRTIMDLFMIFNGRKGFYCKQFIGHRADPDDNLGLWMNMLAQELRNSGNGSAVDGISVRGNGIVNGSKVRCAIYHIFDILRYGEPIPWTDPIYSNIVPYCILGRDIHYVQIWGTEDGVGYLNSQDNKYYIDVVITDLYKKDAPSVTITKLIGDSPLYTNQVTDIDLSGYSFPYSLYDINVKEFTTEVTVSYNVLRDIHEPNPNDYIYEAYGPADLYIKTLYYIGTVKEVIMPEHFNNDSDSLVIIGSSTFADTDVERVYIPEGVTTIE